MKYLIIATLVAVAFVLIYSRLRPYLKLLQKVLQSLTIVAESSVTSPQAKTPSKNKLIRCDGCGTWIPANRALSLKSGNLAYCSAECLEKEPRNKERKLAG